MEVSGDRLKVIQEPQMVFYVGTNSITSVSTEYPAISCAKYILLTILLNCHYHYLLLCRPGGQMCFCYSHFITSAYHKKSSLVGHDLASLECLSLHLSVASLSLLYRY